MTYCRNCEEKWMIFEKIDDGTLEVHEKTFEELIQKSNKKVIEELQLKPNEKF